MHGCHNTTEEIETIGYMIIRGGIWLIVNLIEMCNQCGENRRKKSDLFKTFEVVFVVADALGKLIKDIE